MMGEAQDKPASVGAAPPPPTADKATTSSNHDQRADENLSTIPEGESHPSPLRETLEASSDCLGEGVPQEQSQDSNDSGARVVNAKGVRWNLPREKAPVHSDADGVASEAGRGDEKVPGLSPHRGGNRASRFSSKKSVGAIPSPKGQETARQHVSGEQETTSTGEGLKRPISGAGDAAQPSSEDGEAGSAEAEAARMGAEKGFAGVWGVGGGYEGKPYYEPVLGKRMPVEKVHVCFCIYLCAGVLVLICAHAHAHAELGY